MNADKFVAIWTQLHRDDQAMIMTIDGQLIDDARLRSAVVAEASALTLTGRPSTLGSVTAYGARGRATSTIPVHIDGHALEIGLLCAGDVNITSRASGFAELLHARADPEELREVTDAMTLALRPGCLGIRQ